MLRNSSRELIPFQKYLLYRTCILFITLYNFPLWYYNKASLAYLLQELRKIQPRAAIQILGAFHTSPSISIESIASIILIHLYLQKLGGRFQLRMQSLPSNHIIKSLMELRHSYSNNNHWLSLEKLIFKQQLNIKGSVVDTNNRLNGIFPSFISLSTKFSSGDQLINIFPSCFSFYSLNRKSEESRKLHI